VKDRLEAKMQELGGLVAELGQLRKKEDESKCKGEPVATRKSPDERQWRSGLCLQEVENAMLPTITEDKFYPRKTIKYVAMNAHLSREAACDKKRAWLTFISPDEIRDMDDSQSPDIGPPPVSRFESDDPIGFNPSAAPETSDEHALEEGETYLPSNLEMRRKRRESGPQPRCMFEPPTEAVVEEPKKSVRAGAKRKFSVQEDDDKAKSQAEPFRFSRRNTSAPSDSTNPNEPPRPQSPERPVLGSSKFRAMLRCTAC